MEVLKEKPRYSDALALGLLAVAFCSLLVVSYSWDLTARASIGLLDFANIKTYYLVGMPTVFMSLLDGSTAGFKILIECSGLVSVAIFSFLFVFTIGLFKGRLRTKVVFFVVGVIVGLIWNVNRLAFVMAVAYRFGLGAFFVAHYVVSPTIDFLWIVAIWSLTMSRLRIDASVVAP